VSSQFCVAKASPPAASEYRESSSQWQDGEEAAATAIHNVPQTAQIRSGCVHDKTQQSSTDRQHCQSGDYPRPLLPQRGQNAHTHSADLPYTSCKQHLNPELIQNMHASKQERSIMASTCQPKALKLRGFALLLALVFPLAGITVCLSTVAAAGSKTILLGCRVTRRPHTAARLTRKGLPSQQAMLSELQLADDVGAP